MPNFSSFYGGVIDLEKAATKLTKPSPLEPYLPHLHHVLTRCHSCQGWGTSGRNTPAKDIPKAKWKKFKSVQIIVQSPNQLVNTIESPVILFPKKNQLIGCIPWWSRSLKNLKEHASPAKQQTPLFLAPDLCNQHRGGPYGSSSWGLMLGRWPYILIPQRDERGVYIKGLKKKNGLKGKRVWNPSR